MVATKRVLMKTRFIGLLLLVEVLQSLGPRAAANAADGQISRVALASQSGALLNSNLLKGGGADDTAALQAVLDRGADGKPVHLIIDGVALVSGLNAYGNTIVECLDGAGLYLKDGSSRAIIRNAHRSRGTIT